MGEIFGAPVGEYYSVGFFKEFIVGGRAGGGVPIAVGMVSSEELVEDGCEVGHWRYLATAGKQFSREPP